MAFCYKFNSRKFYSRNDRQVNLKSARSLVWYYSYWCRFTKAAHWHDYQYVSQCGLFVRV